VVPATVLVLGGTAEARGLAEALAGRADLRVVSSLAGRVREPVLPAGEVRVGGFGGPVGLAAWLRAERVAAVVDATHPFADRITASAGAATTALGIPLLVLRRPGWRPEPGDDWRWVPSLAAAAEALPGLGERVFLAVGRQGLAAFAGLDDRWFLVRTVDAPQPPLPRRAHLLRDRGPYTVEGELDLLRRHRIDVLVTKDSGGAATAAKLVAARRLRLPVVIVRRPPAPAGPGLDTVDTVDAVDAALAWLAGVLG
jgi:precorrin-6A/cobalt-precorrin-6A reductase